MRVLARRLRASRFFRVFRKTSGSATRLYRNSRREVASINGHMCITFTSTGPAATFCTGSPLPHYVPKVSVAYMADGLVVTLTVDVPYLIAARLARRPALASAIG